MTRLARQTAFKSALLVVFPAVAIGLWAVFSKWLVAPFWISSPSEVATRLVQWITSGYIFAQLGTTFLEIVSGYIIGATLAVAAALGLYFAPLGRTAIMPYISAVYSIPKIALAPLFVIFFGIGVPSKLALVVFAVFFVVFLNTAVGTQHLDEGLRRALTIMGATEFEYFRKVVIPSTLLWIVAGLRISVRYAITSSVVAEIVSSNRGVGFLIQHYADNFDTTGVFAALISLLCIGLLMNFSLVALERRISKRRE